MKGFSERSNSPELMDQPGVPATEISIALQELETINTWLGGYAPVLDGLKKFSNGTKLTVVDIGSGGGDVLRKVHQWAAENGFHFELTGLDINPLMTEFAKQKSLGLNEMHFVTGNAFNLQEAVKPPDIIISTLFCHHLDNNQLTELIRSMKNSCKRGFIINDLHRHPLAWSGIKLLTRLFSRSYLVKYDGPLSVKRAFTRREWIKLLKEAGIDNYTIRWFWAWRWQIIYRKSP